jgi:hypothetical protein
MIALAINQTGQSDTNDDDSQVWYGLVWQPLWTPCYPGEVSLIPVPQLLRTPGYPEVSDNPQRLKYQSFNRILNINFGGPGGRNLKKLTRIGVHMENIMTTFVGLMFEFDGETPIFCGKRGRIEVPFVINGGDGERIFEITYEQVLPRVGIRSLRVCQPHPLNFETVAKR